MDFDAKLIKKNAVIKPNMKVDIDQKRPEKETEDEVETADLLLQELGLKKGNKVFTEKTLLHDQVPKSDIHGSEKTYLP